MIYQVTLSSVLALFPTWLADLSGVLSQIFNGLAGHSKAFDKLISLPLENSLIKAAVIGACFFAAWFGRQTPAETQKARKALLITLIASVFVLATTKVVSHTVFLPRPFIQSQKFYHLEGDRLIENKRIGYRVPLDYASQENYENLLKGNIQTDDLGSFPSDHAGFFVAISLGIWLASRSLGLISLGWTFLIVLLSKLVTGMHSPIDIAAGAGIAAVELSLCWYLGQRYLGGLLDKVSLWTLKNSALSSAFAFAVVFEISSTLTHLQPLLKLAASAGKHAFGIGS